MQSLLLWMVLLSFVEAIEKVGVVEQEAQREYLTITEVMSYTDSETGAGTIIR